MKKVRVFSTVDVAGYGRVESGVLELPDWLADLLIERGNALTQEEENEPPAEDAI